MTRSAQTLDRDRLTGVSHSEPLNQTRSTQIQGTTSGFINQDKVITAPVREKHKVQLRKRSSSSHPLRDLRTQAGFTLEDLAIATKMSPSYLSRLESGSRRLNEDILSRLSHVLNCDPSALLTQVRSKAPTNSITSLPKNINAAPDLPIMIINDQTDDGGAIITSSNEKAHRPLDYQDIRNAFGCRLETSYWSPRYQTGDTLLMNPFAPLKDGCPLFVKTKNNTVYIGTYKATSSEDLPKDLTLKTTYSSEERDIVFSLKDIEASKITGTIGA